MKRISQIPRRYFVAVAAILIEVTLALAWFGARWVRRTAASTA